MTIYDIVKDLCDKKGISIFDLERKSAIGNGTIGRWKDGAKPNLSTLEAISKTLEIDVSDLLKDRGNA